MLESLKRILIANFTQEVDEYNSYLNSLKSMEEKIRNDNSDKEYLEKVNNLKKEYRLKRIYNSDKKKEYLKELNYLNEEYNNNLREFKLFYDEYEKLKKYLSKWDIYKAKKKLDEIPKCENLRDFKLSSNEIKNILKQNGVYDKLTSDEIEQINNL